MDDATKTACSAIAARLEAQAFEARYERSDKLHVTLAFLGNVDTSALPAIEAAIDDVAALVEPFSFTLNKVGAFPHERRPRVVYIGSREQGPAYRDLANRLRGAYRALGFTFGDDAVAHVTIARVKQRDVHRPLPLLDVEPMTLRVENVALFESIADANTTRYLVRHVRPLSGH